MMDTVLDHLLVLLEAQYITAQYCTGVLQLRSSSVRALSQASNLHCLVHIS